jgi:hypothetical protein
MLIRGVFNREPKVSRMVYGTMAVVAVWGLIGILGDCVGCSPDAIISQSGGEQCVGSVSIHTPKYPVSLLATLLPVHALTVFLGSMAEGRCYRRCAHGTGHHTVADDRLLP